MLCLLRTYNSCPQTLDWPQPISNKHTTFFHHLSSPLQQPAGVKCLQVASFLATANPQDWLASGFEIGPQFKNLDHSVLRSLLYLDTFLGFRYLLPRVEAHTCTSRCRSKCPPLRIRTTLKQREHDHSLLHFPTLTWGIDGRILYLQWIVSCKA